jgi:hypothetical protein
MMASQQAKAVSALLLTLKQRTQSLTSLLVKMDLGFGNANQVLGEVAAKALLQSSKAQEVALDVEMQRYDALLEDEDALEQLRARRLVQLKNTQKQRQQWKEQGHGVYSSLLEGQDDVAKAFFEATKQSQHVVIHFYRPTTASFDIFHSHLQELACQHLEMRFIKINVEGCEKGTNGAAVDLMTMREDPGAVRVEVGILAEDPNLVEVNRKGTTENRTIRIGQSIRAE